jgi:hypothetical protein
LLDGTDLFAEVALEGTQGFTAAAEREDGLVLDVFEPEGEVAVEGGGEDCEADLPGGGL